MPLPQPDPSNPALPAPLFADVDAVRGDHLRANNQLIWEDLQYLQDGYNIADATAKTTPVDADVVPLADSAASNIIKKLTFANLWVWVKSKFNTLAAGTALGGTEKIVMAQSGAAVYTTPADLKTYIAPLYAKISDTKSAGTGGGAFTPAGSYVTRTLQTEDIDASGIVSIASNQFTLQAGTYQIKATAPASRVDGHYAILYNATDAAAVTGCNGTTEWCEAAGFFVVTRSIISGQFTIAGAKAFEIRHMCGYSGASSTLGVAMNQGTSEVYTVVEIWKLA